MYSKPLLASSMIGNIEYAFLAGLPIGEYIVPIGLPFFKPSLAASEIIYFALKAGIVILRISIGRTGFVIRLIG